MEKNNQLPSIPSNYVTLSQLQERWFKDKQQLKEKEKEHRETLNQHMRHPLNENAQPRIEAPRPKQGYENRRTDNRGYGGRYRNLKNSFSGDSPKEGFVGAVAVIKGSETENTSNEMKSKDLGVDTVNMTEREQRKKKKVKRKNKKQEGKEKILKDGETMTQGEEEVVERVVIALPAKSNKESIPVRRYGKKWGIRLDFRPKNSNLVGKSNPAVEMVGEVKNVTGKSESTVEIARQIGDLCIEEGSDISETQNNIFPRRNSKYRSRGRIVDNRYKGYNRTVNHNSSQYRGYNGVLNRRNTEYRGSNGGGYRGNRHFSGSDQGFNPILWKARDNGNDMVWVKKGGVVEDA